MTVVENEVWKDIEDYEGLYQISNFGRIKSLSRFNSQTERILKQNINKSGYVYVGLSKDNKINWYRVHRLVAQAFIPNPNNLPQVNHKDECKTNNCVNNLEWCTSKYNMNYTKAKQIIQMDLEGNEIKRYSSLTEITEELGFSQGHISKCCNGLRKTAYGFRWKCA